jgi:VRR-NUC domain
VSRLAVSEKAFQSSVVQLARMLAWRVFFVRESVGSPEGWPDLVLVRHDRFIVRELKTETGRLSPAQRGWIAALEEAGVDVAVWRPADWPRIEATLVGQVAIEVQP